MCGWVCWVCDVTKERLGEVKSTSNKSRCNQMFQGFPIALVKPSPVTVTGPDALLEKVLPTLSRNHFWPWEPPTKTADAQRT